VKILEISGAIIAFLILIIIGFLYFGFSDLCANEIHKVYMSPNKSFKAVVFERNCGATTSFSTQISILDSNEELENEEGNVFIISGHPDTVAPYLKWASNVQLKINHRLNGQESKALVEYGLFSKVKVKYRGSNR